mmetsp:Transcript_29296/g.94419  ORF Transcript_29296/g.94419 Transcript_29296/m.94419 type:complete len:221 (-) Transcript_29296:175-837(-)
MGMRWKNSPLAWPQKRPSSCRLSRCPSVKARQTSWIISSTASSCSLTMKTCIAFSPWKGPSLCLARMVSGSCLKMLRHRLTAAGWLLTCRARSGVAPLASVLSAKPACLKSTRTSLASNARCTSSSCSAVLPPAFCFLLDASGLSNVMFGYRYRLHEPAGSVSRSVGSQAGRPSSLDRWSKSIGCSVVRKSSFHWIVWVSLDERVTTTRIVEPSTSQSNV